jgi:hypothetical protein
MGSMHFHLPSSLPTGGAHALQCARFTGGYDRTPFPTERHIQNKLLHVVKPQNESCSFGVPWPVPNLGFPVTTTATLRERSDPYFLLIELARGKLNQVRNAVADWQAQGLAPSAAVQAEYKAAHRAFGRAIQDPSSSDADAVAAIQHSYAASLALAKQFAQAAISIRGQRDRRLPTRWSCRTTSPLSVDHTRLFTAGFTAVDIEPDWVNLEPTSSRMNWDSIDATLTWSEAAGLRPSLGPLIDFGGRLPGWLEKSAGDFPSLSAYFCDFVESTVHRYRNRVKNWLVCTGFNHLDRLGITEDDRLRMVIRLIESAKTADPDGRWVVGLSMPWGDYLENEEHTYSPLVFADTLLRSGLPIAGFELEIYCGGDDRSSLLRDPLDTVRLLDLFGLLGVPIDVVARHPGRVTDDTGSTTDRNHVSTCWMATDSPEAQRHWGDWLSELVLSFPHVRSFVWNSWADRGDDALGLIDAHHAPKPLLSVLTQRRTMYL